MNDAMAATSECSSGVESGWTLYLDHSYINHNNNNNAYYQDEEEESTEKRRNKKHHDDSADEEDLSMLSDASSWPPHHDPNYFNNNQQQNNYYENHQNGSFSNSASKSVKLSSSTKTHKKKKKNKVKEIQHMPSYLHDTASSHVFDFSPNKVDGSNQQTYTESMLDCSQGFSATYFQRKSSCQEHFGFFQPSLSENEIQGNSWYGGKGIGMR